MDSAGFFRRRPEAPGDRSPEASEDHRRRTLAGRGDCEIGRDNGTTTHKFHLFVVRELIADPDLVQQLADLTFVAVLDDETQAADFASFWY
jgi:hypothetical protein